MNWSPYNEAIFDFAADDNAGSLNVDAKAGSGKSTTCIELIQRCSLFQTYMAFNKSIVEEFQGWITNTRCDISTFNSKGHRALGKAVGKLQLNSGKIRDLIQELNIAPGPDNRLLRNQIARLVSLAKNSLIKHDDIAGLLQLSNDYGFAFDDEKGERKLAVDSTSRLIKAGHEMALQGVIDFDDQLYVPIIENMQIPKTLRLYIDEAQDLNPVRMEFATRMVSTNGRIFVIGDPNQAIYGFQGSDANAMDKMAGRFNSKTLPLSVSYRCPKQVILEAQKYVPEIEAAADAIEGKVVRYDKTSPNEANQSFRVTSLVHTDLILCRLNGPLMSVAWRLFDRKIPFQMVGREFGELLRRHIEIVLKKNKVSNMDSGRFCKALADYREAEIEKHISKGNIGIAYAIEDQCNAVERVAEEVSDTNELNEVIDKIFAGKAGMRLSTVHRAKGTQAPRVFIIDPKFMPFPKATSPREIEQEYNLLYVAITRAQNELHFLPSECLR